MYLLYLDEAGDFNSWQNQNCAVLGGVAVHEGQLERISILVDQLQAKWFPGITFPLEFHASAIRAGKDRFRSFTPADRALMLSDLYGLLAQEQFPQLVAFASTIDVSAVKTPTQALGDAFEDICQRFNTFLVRGFGKGIKNKGLLIIDRSGLFRAPLSRPYFQIPLNGNALRLSPQHSGRAIIHRIALHTLHAARGLGRLGRVSISRKRRLGLPESNTSSIRSKQPEINSAGRLQAHDRTSMRLPGAALRTRNLRCGCPGPSARRRRSGSTFSSTTTSGTPSATPRPGEARGRFPRASRRG